MTGLEQLVGGFIAHQPLLRIWREYPFVTPADDDLTDRWACTQVSDEFIAYTDATSRGGVPFTAVSVLAADNVEELVFDHEWSRLTHTSGEVWDVDFTARQYHNLPAVDDLAARGRILRMPWPLVWDPAEYQPGRHPAAGLFRTITVRRKD